MRKTELGTNSATQHDTRFSRTARRKARHMLLEIRHIQQKGERCVREREDEQVGAPDVRAGGQYAREEGQESIGDVHVVCKGSVSADWYLFGGLEVDSAAKS